MLSATLLILLYGANFFFFFFWFLGQEMSGTALRDRFGIIAYFAGHI